ncbi:MAG: CHASE2 domain-containing protein [Elusimicrobiota bacterium]
MKKSNWLFSDAAVGIVISIIILVGYLLSLTFFETFEYKIYDLRAKFRQDRKPSNKIAIVTIDDQSIANIGRWPWPRSIIADIVNRLSAAEPRAIGLNILFTEPDKNQGLEELRALRVKYAGMIFALKNKIKSKSDQNTMMEFLNLITDAESRMDNDTILADSLLSSGKVTLPMFFNIGKPLGAEEEEIPPVLSSNTLTNVVETKAVGKQKSVSAVEGFAPILPYDIFAEASANIGHSNLIADSDGVIRRATPVIISDGKYYPSFVLQLVRSYLGIPIEQVKVLPGRGIEMGNAKIPLDESMSMLMNFIGPAQTYQYNSVFDVLTEKIPPEVFKGKIILVGHMATGIADLNVTPVGSNFPGTEIIANAIQNILDQRFIQRPSWASTVELATLIIGSLYTVLLLPRLKAKWGAIVTLAIFVVILGAGGYLFISIGLWLKIFYSLSLILLGYLLITSKRFLLTEKRKELVEAESIETNKMLGLSFQGQGMLDLAFEKFRKCPLDDTVKDLLYNLALDFERKRQFNKAVAVYEHIQTVDQSYKDIVERIGMLKQAAQGAVFGIPGQKATGGETVIIDSKAGQKPTLGRYEIEKELGRGAMGIVYLGKDPKINRTVAIKTLQFETDLPEEELKSIKERFFREAESAGALNHPNIIRIYDAGEDYEVSYIAMELLDGEDLKKWCEKGNLFPIKDVIDIVSKVANALDFAHSTGVVHRDIKPANVMMLKDNTIRVTDFGIARIMSSSKTQTGTVLGTPSYMSPEQISGKKVDGRSDLYSLGVMLYEMLTGEKPFGGDSIAALLYQISNEPTPDPRKVRPELPECLVNVVFKATAKNPDERYQKGTEFETDLKSCLAVIEGKAPAPVQKAPVAPAVSQVSKVQPVAPAPQPQVTPAAPVAEIKVKETEGTVRIAPSKPPSVSTPPAAPEPQPEQEGTKQYSETIKQMPQVTPKKVSETVEVKPKSVSETIKINPGEKI